MITILILIPLLGAKLSYFGNRYVCIMSAIVELLFCCFVVHSFNPDVAGMQLTESFFGLFNLSLDGFSLPFVFLNAVLVPICLLVHKQDKNSFYFLILQAILMLFFMSSDLLYFFVFFEASLIPMFFIIGIWGGKRRVYAAFKILLYTLVGSISFMVSVAYIKINYGSTDFAELSKLLVGATLQEKNWLWWGLFIALAVKIPMFPLHSWLPDAHVQAPTSGSVMLAGVLIKMGGYGFLRVLIPLLPESSKYFADLVIWLSVIAVIYTSLIALVQKDMKKLVAYSSIAHMGFATAAIFSFNENGISGAMFQMVSHALISSGLFLCVGQLYSRTKTREISLCSGVANSMPKFSTIFIVFSMASIGLPTTSGFIGEFLSIIGVFEHSKVMGSFVASGIILGSLYMLWLCKRVIWGKAIENMKLEDTHYSECLPLLILVAGVLILGIFPDLLLYPVRNPVLSLLKL